MGKRYPQERDRKLRAVTASHSEGNGRPKELYARLGFRPAWTAMEFVRLP
jgi:hypothetical protein